MDIVKKNIYGIVVLIGIISLSIFFLSNRFPSLSPEAQSVGDINVLTFNTEYWHTSEKELLDGIVYKNYDIIFLQEHLQLIGDEYFPTNKVGELKKIINNRHIDFNGEVLTISKWPIVNRKNFGDGTALRTDLVTDEGHVISAYNVHLPVHLHLDLLTKPIFFWKDMVKVSKERESLMAALKADINDNNNSIIVAGDLNTSVAMNGIDYFRNTMVDAYSSAHCERQYSTWDLLPYLGWRIDYIFVSKDLIANGYCTKRLQEISDHRAIKSTLSFKYSEGYFTKRN